LNTCKFNDVQELENLDDAALRDLYEMRVQEQRAAAGREDFSGAPWHSSLVLKTALGIKQSGLDQHALSGRCADMVAAKAAQQKRKASEKASASDKFKF
jgi:hypothetical protein